MARLKTAEAGVLRLRAGASSRPTSGVAYGSFLMDHE
jgi:hypothetical protein